MIGKAGCKGLHSAGLQVDAPPCFMGPLFQQSPSAGSPCVTWGRSASSPFLTETGLAVHYLAVILQCHPHAIHSKGLISDLPIVYRLVKRCFSSHFDTFWALTTCERAVKSKKMIGQYRGHERDKPQHHRGADFPEVGQDNFISKRTVLSSANPNITAANALDILVNDGSREFCPRSWR